MVSLTSETTSSTSPSSIRPSSSFWRSDSRFARTFLSLDVQVTRVALAFPMSSSYCYMTEFIIPIANFFAMNFLMLNI